tara:strand:+ start:4952 stop:5254 length:303 start_codon:yes stop_codon:yes gene_type:complete
MRFNPVNRHLAITLQIKEKKEDNISSDILLPQDYRPLEEQYSAAKINSCARDCAQFSDEAPYFSRGNTIIVERSMVKEITHAGEIFHIIQENYVLGSIER